MVSVLVNYLFRIIRSSKRRRNRVDWRLERRTRKGKNIERRALCRDDNSWALKEVVKDCKQNEQPRSSYSAWTAQEWSLFPNAQTGFCNFPIWQSPRSRCSADLTLHMHLFLDRISSLIFFFPTICIIGQLNRAACQQPSLSSHYSLFFSFLFS